MKYNKLLENLISKISDRIYDVINEEIYKFKHCQRCIYENIHLYSNNWYLDHIDNNTKLMIDNNDSIIHRILCDLDKDSIEELNVILKDVYTKLTSMWVSALNREPISPMKNYIIVVKEKIPYMEFPKYKTILLNTNNYRLYYGTVYERYSPNWNHECELFGNLVDLTECEVPFCQSSNKVGFIETTFLSILNQIENDKTTNRDFVSSPDEDGFYKVTIIDDRKMSRLTITGETIDEVFREIANKYQGIRNYRRPSVSEYKIENLTTNRFFNEWLKTATGLKSDFDKFYGGGIVD